MLPNVAGARHPSRVGVSDGSGAAHVLRWVRLCDRLAHSRVAVYTLFCLLYFPATFYIASRKLFWDDEFFTLFLSSTRSWHDLIRAMSTGADQHPPSFYYLTHIFLQVFGTSHITLRLPQILGFAVLCLALYEIARMITTPLWAVVAMCFPLTTQLYYYASEARGYGLVCAFSALALLAWMKATRQAHRAAMLVLLGASVMCAVASHYYAVMLVSCLGAAEIVRSWRNRRLGLPTWDLPIWIALSCSVLPLLVFSGVIRDARRYSTHFWAVPVWTDTLRFYGTEVALGASALVLAVALANTVGERTHPAQRNSRLATRLSASWATALWSIALTPFAIMFMAKFFTHGFSDRYTIEAVVGISVLVPWILSVAFPQNRSALVALAVSLLIFVFQFHSLRDQNRSAVLETQADLRFLSGNGSETTVVSDNTRFQRLSFYAPRSLATHLVYVSDPVLSIKYLGHDTIDRGMLDLREWFPMRTYSAQRFVPSHQDFLVYGAVTDWNWITNEMSGWGEAQLQSRVRDRILLFSLHRRDPVSMLVSDRVEGLYDRVPHTGPALCHLYFQADTCMRGLP